MTTTSEEQKNEKTNEPPKGDDAKGSAEEGKRVSLFVSLTMGPEESDHADPGSDVPIARGEVSLFIPGGDFAGAMFAALPKLVEVASQGRVRVAPVGEHLPGCPRVRPRPNPSDVAPVIFPFDTPIERELRIAHWEAENRVRDKMRENELLRAELEALRDATRIETPEQRGAVPVPR